jgi:Domain of unknown function (DUF4331)
MPRYRRKASGLALLAAAAAVATIGTGSLFVSAADHLDAPTAKSDSRIDITDIYAFKSSGGTTLVMNVNPLTSPADTTMTRFRNDTLYEFKIDTNGDAWADIAYRIRFNNIRAAANGAIVQDYTIKRATGADARVNRWNGRIVDRGRTSAYGGATLVSAVAGGGKSFAGPRDDPFFFDLPGFVEFKKQLVGGSTDLGVLLGGFTGTDTFAGTNVSSIAIEVPNIRLGGTGRTVGVWAAVSRKLSLGNYEQVDRMGRPAINTVFNNTNAEKEAANRLIPSDDRAFDMENVVGVLEAIDNVLEINGASSYTADEINGIAKVLLPDTLTVKLGDPAGFLNGRRLADDVIDAEFGLLTNGAVASDGVDKNDRAFLTTFPYLAKPR